MSAHHVSKLPRLYLFDFLFVFFYTKAHLLAIFPAFAGAKMLCFAEADTYLLKMQHVKIHAHDIMLKDVK